MKITRAKGGTKQRLVRLNNIAIPDLWNIAMAQPPEDRRKVLECWHLCHELLTALRDIESQGVKGTARLLSSVEAIFRNHE